MNSRIVNFIFGIGLLVAGCNSNEPVCPGESISKLRIEFTREKDSTSNYFVVYHPALADSLYNNDTAPTIVSVPMDITADSMVVYIDFISKTDSTFEKVTDVVAITYQSHSYMDNLDCGLITNFEIQKVYYSQNHMNKLYIVNQYINSENVTHVEISY